MANVKITNISTSAVTVAGTETPGIASFSAKDFRVNSDGHVYSKQKVGAIQYIGTISGFIQTETPLLFAWNVNTKISPKPLADIKAGDLILNTSDYSYSINDEIFTFTEGMVFVIKSVADGVVTTGQPLFNLKGDKGDKGDRGTDGTGAGVSLVNIRIVDLGNNQYEFICELSDGTTFSAGIITIPTSSGSGSGGDGGGTPEPEPEPEPEPTPEPTPEDIWATLEIIAGYLYVAYDELLGYGELTVVVDASTGEVSLEYNNDIDYQISMEDGCLIVDQ